MQIEHQAHGVGGRRFAGDDQRLLVLLLAEPTLRAKGLEDLPAVEVDLPLTAVGQAANSEERLAFGTEVEAVAAVGRPTRRQTTTLAKRQKPALRRALADGFRLILGGLELGHFGPGGVVFVFGKVFAGVL